MDEEQLLEFLYIAPVALIRFDSTGKVAMANPRVAQLFNRYAPGGYFENFFTFLSDVLPELKAEITAFDLENGQIMENHRFCLSAPDGTDSEDLWMDVTVVKQDNSSYIASLNNVTNQVRTESEKHIVEQQLHRLFESVSEHVIFTMTPSGVVDSWNMTGETHITPKSSAVGKMLSQLLPISIAKNAEYLHHAASDGMIRDTFHLKDKNGEEHSAGICISAIHDMRDQHRGFSVVLTLGNKAFVN